MQPASDRATPKRALDPVQLIASIGSPIALGTALLLYFGWVRSEAQARAFGAEASVFEMSAQDLVLRSIDVLFFPIVLLLLGGLLLLRLDPVLRSSAARLSPILRRAWLLIVPGLFLRAVTGSVGDVIFPLWVLLAVGGTAYGNLLRRHATGDRTPPGLIAIALVVALVVVALFWQTERLARLGGTASAQDLKDHLAQRLPSVSLHSAGRLHIDAPGVVQTPLAEPDASYRYRYGGLYLLQRSGGKYFLVTDGWSNGQGRLLVLPDTSSIRLEFGAGLDGTQ